MNDFYGAKIVPLHYKDGTQAKLGDVIRWHCFDNEENKTWTFTGIYKSDKVIYLGGGIDFGMGIGSIKTVESVMEQAEDNDSYEQGIEKVGVAGDVARLISTLSNQ